MLSQVQVARQIRELRNVVKRALALARTELIEVSGLPPSLQSKALADRKPDAGATVASRYEALDDAEQGYLTSLLRKDQGNVSQAAQQAGMSRQGMHKLLKEHGIAAAAFRECQPWASVTPVIDTVVVPIVVHCLARSLRRLGIQVA